MDILHIFVKDVRRMWVPLAAFAALMILADVLEVRRHFHDEFREAEAISFVGALVVPLAWIVVIAGVVLQDRLQGTSQYWLTRPVSRWQLLGAKMLFIAVFVNLLWFVSDCVILLALGLPIPPLVLLARQIPMTVILFGPVIGLATMVRNAGQFALGLLISLLAVLLESLAPQLFGRLPPTFFRNGIPSSVAVALWLAVGALTFVAMLWQFLRNSTLVARAALALAILLTPIANERQGGSPLIGRGAGTKTSKGPGAFGELRVSFDLGTGRMTRRSSIGFEVPVRVEGLPSGMIASAWGNSKVLKEETERRTELHNRPDGYWLEIQGDDLKAAGPVAAELEVAVWHVESEKVLSAKNPGVFSPSAGFVCRVERGPFECWHAPEFEYGEMLEATALGHARFADMGRFLEDDSALPAGFSPLVEVQLSQNDDFEVLGTQFLTLKPVATVAQTIKADAVDFSQ